MDNRECKMTFSAFVHDKSGKRIVRVQFERPGVRGGEKDIAEGIVPGGRIDRSKGFSEEEMEQLSAYLAANEADILARARAISNPMRWMS
ncbi:MAG: hypothetical protein K6B72_05950 [Lachnospiraceae bacterium]|nr:hypothetical protein [Lachnospiraceae bacterium]